MCGMDLWSVYLCWEGGAGHGFMVDKKERKEEEDSVLEERRGDAQEEGERRKMGKIGSRPVWTPVCLMQTKAFCVFVVVVSDACLLGM